MKESYKVWRSVLCKAMNVKSQIYCVAQERATVVRSFLLQVWALVRPFLTSPITTLLSSVVIIAPPSASPAYSPHPSSPTSRPRPSRSATHSSPDFDASTPHSAYAPPSRILLDHLSDSPSRDLGRTARTRAPAGSSRCRLAP